MYECATSLGTELDVGEAKPKNLESAILYIDKMQRSMNGGIVCSSDCLEIKRRRKKRLFWGSDFRVRPMGEVVLVGVWVCGCVPHGLVVNVVVVVTTN